MTRTLQIIVALTSVLWLPIGQSRVDSTQVGSTETPVLRLVLMSMSACVGVKEIEAEVVLRNTTKTLVSFDLELFHQSISFLIFEVPSVEKANRKVKGYSASWLESSSLPPHQVVTLQPGESYWVATKISLKAESSEKPGFLNVSATYIGLSLIHI